jgi:hypothetical protein
MSKQSARSIQFARQLAFGFAFILFISSNLPAAWCGLLPLPAEQDSWSDMAFPTGVSGSFNAGTKTLTITASPSNDLEIGGEFGPSNIGRHYGTGGTLGGPFSATLNLTGVIIETDGTVTSGGAVTVTFNNGAPGSIGTDYGIVSGAPLLTGTVREVLLDATGDNTLDVLLEITGGALQNDNPDPDVGVFAPNNHGLLRIAGVTMPSDWSSTFSLNGATIDLLGVPEPTALFLGILGVAFAWMAATRRNLCEHRTR